MLFWQIISNWTSTRQQKHLNIESCQTYGECVFYAVLQLGNTSNSKKLLLNSDCFCLAAAAHAVIQDCYWPIL